MIRNQDSTRYVTEFLRNPATRDVAWKFIQTHGSDVEKTFTFGSGGDLVSSTGQFCELEAAQKVSAFFKVHTVPASERALRQAVERINSCADLKKLQQSNLESWISQHNGAQVPAGGN